MRERIPSTHASVNPGPCHAPIKAKLVIVGPQVDVQQRPVSSIAFTASTQGSKAPSCAKACVELSTWIGQLSVISNLWRPAEQLRQRWKFSYEGNASDWTNFPVAFGSISKDPHQSGTARHAVLRLADLGGLMGDRSGWASRRPCLSQNDR